jgi:hypothetical protein
VVIDGNTLLEPLIDTDDAFSQINESKNGNGDLYYFSKPITQEDWSLIFNFLKTKYPDIKWFWGGELENYIKYPNTVVLYISPGNKLSVGFGGVDYMNEPRYNGWGKYNGDEIFDIIDTHDAFNQINESVEGEQIIYRFETPITEDSWPIICSNLEKLHPGIRWGSNHKLEDWFIDGMYILDCNYVWSGWNLFQGGGRMSEKEIRDDYSPNAKILNGVVLLLDDQIDTHDMFGQINERRKIIKKVLRGL